MIPPRIARKIFPAFNGCWLWLASKLPSGYGQVWDGEKRDQAHTVVYELLVGPVPEGYELDHTCRNRSCVNPDRLEPVTHRENMRRSDAIMGQNARKTTCKRGHELDEGNTYVTASGARQCKACGAMHAKVYKAQKRDSLLLRK